MVNFRTLLTTIGSRAFLQGLLGQTFGGERDVYKALGYKRELSVEDYWLRYRRNSIAARIIEAYPKGTWRGQALELLEIEDPERFTPFETAWNELAVRLKLVPTFMQWDILSGIGRYGVLLLGAPGDLNTPLPKPLPPENLLFVTPFAEDVATIKTYNEDITSPRFGHGEIYEFKKLNPSNLGRSYEVHWSRVIHAAEGSLQDKIFGPPRLERVWNNLDDLDKLIGGGSEAFWLRAHQGYHMDIDKETEFQPGEEDQLDEEADEFVHNVRRYMRTRGVKLTALGSDVADFAVNVDSVIGVMSAGTGIPQRILMGSERGQLASEQDRVNWAERLQDRRTEFAGPRMVRPFADRLIEHETLPPPAEYFARWTTINDLSDDERAKIGSKWAEINQKAGEVVVTVNEIRDRVLGLAPIDPAERRVFKPVEAPEDRKGNGEGEGTPGR